MTRLQIVTSRGKRIPVATLAGMHDLTHHDSIAAPVVVAVLSFLAGALFGYVLAMGGR